MHTKMSTKVPACIILPLPQGAAILKTHTAFTCSTGFFALRCASSPHAPIGQCKTSSYWPMQKCPLSRFDGVPATCPVCQPQDGGWCPPQLLSCHWETSLPAKPIDRDSSGYPIDTGQRKRGPGVGDTGGSIQHRGERGPGQREGKEEKPPGDFAMTDGMMSKAATMEIPINGNGDTGSLPEDDSLEQDLQQVMVSGPNLNETSIVSGGYGGTTEGIIPTGNIKGSNMHQCHNNASMSEELSRGLAVEKFDVVKKWGINTYKCTKQMFSERFGRGSRTVDLELETQIELLRDTKRKYESVLQLARALTNHFYNMVQTQRALGDAFSDLSQKSPELQEEFGYNAETQKLLCRNGETLLGAVNFFVSSINTLVNKTMEDTLMTVKLYETARLEYDAYRTDLEELTLGPRDAATLCRIDVAQQNFQIHKEKYEKLRGDVAIKLKFLEENKIKVMHKQLLLFHNAISAYFAGNQQQLEQTLKQFNIKLKTPGAEKPSWLEEQ